LRSDPRVKLLEVCWDGVRFDLLDPWLVGRVAQPGSIDQQQNPWLSGPTLANEYSLSAAALSLSTEEQDTVMLRISALGYI
jgi:hypothetical protein